MEALNFYWVYYIFENTLDRYNKNVKIIFAKFEISFFLFKILFTKVHPYVYLILLNPIKTYSLSILLNFQEKRTVFGDFSLPLQFFFLWTIYHHEKEILKKYLKFDFKLKHNWFKVQTLLTFPSICQTLNSQTVNTRSSTVHLFVPKNGHEQFWSWLGVTTLVISIQSGAT